MMCANLNNSVMTCSACQTELLLGDEYLLCMVAACGKLYHYACNNRILSTEEKASWACPECTCAAKKGGQNCETPVGTPVNIKNVALRNLSGSGVKPSAFTTQRSEDDLPVSPHLEIQLLREQMCVLSEQLADAVSTIGRYHSALVVCTGRVEVISKRLAKLEHVDVPRCPSCNKLTQSSPGDAACELDKTRETYDPKINGGGEQRRYAKSLQVLPNGDDATPNHQEYSGNDKPHVAEPNDSAGGEWKTVGPRKQKRQISLRCTAGPTVTTLKAVEYRKHIHLWNMESGADEIRDYLRNLCPNGTCTVEELKSKGDYKSFKLGVPAVYFDSCLSVDVWPENARVKTWLFRRQIRQSKM